MQMFRVLSECFSLSKRFDAMRVATMFCSAVLMLFSLSPLDVAAQQSELQNVLELESVIQGNQEQPKVLYIVPWRKIEGPGVVYQPMQRLIQKNFSTIDREEFKREVEYRHFSESQGEADGND